MPRHRASSSTTPAWPSSWRWTTPSYDAQWSRVLDILLTAPQRVALPHLRRSRAGRVINIASTEALAAQSLGLPARSYITGVVLPVDGGQTARSA